MIFSNIAFLRLIPHIIDLKIVQNAFLKKSGLEMTLALGGGNERWDWPQRGWGNFWSDGVFHILIGIWVTQACHYQNSANAHFHFMKLYIQRGKLCKYWALTNDMLKYLESSLLISAIYLEMYEKIRWMDGWLDGYICDKKVKNRIRMVGIWVFPVKFFQLCFMFETFHSKMLA